MKPLRLFLMTSFVAVQGTPLLADSPYPRECCPRTWTCAPVEGSGQLAVSPGKLPRAVLMSGYGSVPIPGNVRLRESKDNRMHACIGYNDFGDREVKCLLLPTIM